MHQAQRFQRLAAAVDEVAAKPEPVARRVEADAFQQPLGGAEAALQVSDRPDAHALECKRLARCTKSTTDNCSARAPGSRPAPAMSAASAMPDNALRSVFRRWPNAARTTASKLRASSMPIVPAGRGTNRTRKSLRSGTRGSV